MRLSIHDHGNSGASYVIRSGTLLAVDDMLHATTSRETLRPGKTINNLEKRILQK